LAPKEITKLLSKTWKAFNDDEKKKYKDLAEERKKAIFRKVSKLAYYTKTKKKLIKQKTKTKKRKSKPLESSNKKTKPKKYKI